MFSDFDTLLVIHRVHLFLRIEMYLNCYCKTLILRSIIKLRFNFRFIFQFYRTFYIIFSKYYCNRYFYSYCFSYFLSHFCYSFFENRVLLKYNKDYNLQFY